MYNSSSLRIFSPIVFDEASRSDAEVVICMDVVLPLDAATAIVHCSEESGRNVKAVRSPVIEVETLAAECNALPARFNF